MAEPVMSVVFDGQIHQIKVSGGIDGKAAFEADIRRIFRLSADDELSLTFGCRVPGSEEAQELTLEGWGSFDAVRRWSCKQTNSNKTSHSPDGPVLTAGRSLRGAQRRCPRRDGTDTTWEKVVEATSDGDALEGLAPPVHEQ
jgi:hypothetical protein